MKRPLILCAALALAACETAPEGADSEGNSELVGLVVEDDALGGQLSDANSIALSEGEIKQQQARFLELATKFEQTTGKKLSGVKLNKEQAALLETMLSGEQDVTMQGLLQEILDTRNSIFGLQDKIDELKDQLPTPDIVARGDNHLGLATRYLTANHGVSEADAKALAERALLTNNLAPGMEVWHFYVDGVYGTTVTQGTAKVSPFFLNVRQMRKLKRERDEALTLAASLEAEIEVLEATRDQLMGDLKRVEGERDVVQAERDILYEETELLGADNEALVEENESVWFYVDTARRLREKDILAPAGMRLKDWRKDLFEQSLDLRTQSSLTVHAEDFGARKIRKLVLLPSSRFRLGKDYQIEYEDGGARAVIHLDNISKFKDDAFVVVLR